MDVTLQQIEDEMRKRGLLTAEPTVSPTIEPITEPITEPTLPQIEDEMTRRKFQIKAEPPILPEVSINIVEPDKAKLVEIPSLSPKVTSTKSKIDTMIDELKIPSLLPELPKVKVDWGSIGEVAKDTLKAGLETAGVVAGTAIGLRGGVAGAVALSGAGYALAKEIEKLLGLEPASLNSREALNNVLGNLGIGALSEAGGQLTISGLSTILKPNNLSHAQEHIKNLAERLNIKLTPGEITGNLTLQQTEGFFSNLFIASSAFQKQTLDNIAELVKTRQRLIDTYGTKESIEKTGNLIKDKVNAYLGKLTTNKIFETDYFRDKLLQKLGKPNTTMLSLGKSAQTTLAEQSQIWYKQAEVLYDKVSEVTPKDTLFPVKNYKKTLLDLAEGQITPGAGFQNEVLLNSILKTLKLTKEDLFLYRNSPKNVRNAIYNKIEDMSFPAIQQTMKNINAILQADSAKGIPEQKGITDAFTGAYKLIKSSLIEDLQLLSKSNTMGKEARDALTLANAFYREGKTAYNNPLVLKLIQSYKPEDFVQLIAGGGVSSVIAYKKASPKGLDLLRQNLTNVLLKDFTTGDALLQSLKNYGDEVLAEIYSYKEIIQIKELAKLEKGLDKNILDNKFFTTLLNKEPQKVIKYIVQPNNVTNLDLIESKLGKPALNKIANQFLTDKLNWGASPVNLVKELSRYGDNTINRLLGKEVWTELNNLSKVISSVKGIETINKGKSGTHTFLTYSTLGYALYDPIHGVYLVSALYTLPKVYLSPTVTKWLSEGFLLPPTSKEAIKLLTKIVGFVGINNFKKIPADKMHLSPANMNAEIMQLPPIDEKEVSTTKYKLPEIDAESPVSNAIRRHNK